MSKDTEGQPADDCASRLHASGSMDLHKELLHRLHSMESELGQLRSLLLRAQPSISTISPTQLETCSNPKRKIASLEQGGMMGTSDVDPKRKKVKPNLPLDAADEDGLAILPPEIWTHILSYVALYGRHSSASALHQQRAGGESQESGDGDEQDSAEHQDGDHHQQQQGENKARHMQGHEEDAGESGASSTMRANGNAFSGPLGTATLVCRLWRKIGLAQVTKCRVDARKHKQHLRQCLPFLAANCANLRMLNLSNCRIVDSMLHHLPSGLTHLDLSSTQITDACIEYLPLSLRYLYLSDNSITNAGVDDIPPHVDTLALDYTLISVDKEAAVLEQFTSLRSLSLSASEGVTDKGVSVLPSQLEKLILSSSGTLDDYHQFGDDAFYRFGTRYPRLTGLRLDDVDISGAGMRELQQCTSLKQLQLAYCSYITDNDLALLPPNLSSLELHHLRHVEGDGLKHLPGSIEHLCLHRMQHLSVETIAGNLPKQLKVLVLEAAPSGWVDALRKLIPAHIALSASAAESSARW
jgi:hypothetical protein